MKLNKKVVLWGHMANLVWICKKKSDQIVLHLEFKTFRAEILQIFELLIWKIYDFMNSFWLYLTFSMHFINLNKWLIVWWKLCFWLYIFISNLFVFIFNAKPSSMRSIINPLPKSWYIDINSWIILSTTSMVGFLYQINQLPWVLSHAGTILTV